MSPRLSLSLFRHRAPSRSPDSLESLAMEQDSAYLDSRFCGPALLLHRVCSVADSAQLSEEAVCGAWAEL